MVTLDLITFHDGLANEREQFGITLNTPFQVDQTHSLSHWVSLAFGGAAHYATNKIGCLLMTENHVVSDELGSSPNFSHYNPQDIITHTTNWVLRSFSLEAASAYNLIAFGNFFDDSNVEAENLRPKNESDAGYNFFDDFCLTTNPAGCSLILPQSYVQKEKKLQYTSIPQH